MTLLAKIFYCRETCLSEMDFRIQGLLHSAVQEHDHIRKQAVQNVIHQFENQPNKEALQEDLQQNRAFNPFSENLQHGKHGVLLRDLRDHFKHTMLQLSDILAERCCLLHMLRCSVNSQFCHQKKTIPWETPREHKKTEDLPSSPCLFHQSEEEGYTLIQDRFLSFVQHCARLDEIAAEGHSYIATAAE